MFAAALFVSRFRAYSDRQTSHPAEEKQAGKVTPYYINATVGAFRLTLGILPGTSKATAVVDTIWTLLRANEESSFIFSLLKTDNKIPIPPA